MSRSRVTSTRNSGAFRYIARVWDGFSRFLLTAAAVELLTIPLTQYVWTLGQFLRGGQNFDSSVLALLLFPCLLLLLAQQSGHRLSQSVPLGRLFSVISDDRQWAAIIGDQNSSNLLKEQLRNPVFSLDCPPFFRSENSSLSGRTMRRTDMAIHGFLLKETTTLHCF